MNLIKREARHPASAHVWDRFDQMFDEWTRMLPFRPPALGDWPATIRVDEFQENGTLVIRAELPGMDPDKDVELTVSDGMLHIHAQRREEEEKEDKGYLRREIHYGTFSRTLAMPEGIAESDIKASYQNGILEVRVPAPQHKPTTKIPIGGTPQ